MLTEMNFGLKLLTTNLGLFNPYEINFAITYMCNSRCKTCSIWKIKPKNELSLREIEKFAEKNKFINWIRLTGGEPFLRKDYVDIVRVWNDNLPYLYFLSTPTNALLGDLVIKKVKDVLKFFKKNYTISVSLDGTKEIHDNIRGIKGNWDKAIDVYKKLKKLEKKNKNFKVYFGYTISPYNIGMFEKTIEEVRRKIPSVTKKDFHVNLFQLSEVYYGNQEMKVGRDFFEKAKEEIDIALEARRRSLNKIDIVEAKYLKNAKKYLETKKCPIDCNIFNLSCYIDPMGDVYPCTMFNFKLGNLREVDFDLKKILTSAKARKSKEMIVKKKCSHCWTPCEAHQMILSNWLKT